MPDIFISYSQQDASFAEFLHRHLANEDVNVFMASVSLKPGQKWSEEIIEQVKQSSLVLFLASKAACASAYVQQELGIALATNKEIVPVVWDIDPSKLPGWMSRLQALDIQGASPDQIREQMSAIANKIKSKKTSEWLLVAGLLAAGLVIYTATRNK